MMVQQHLYWKKEDKNMENTNAKDSELARMPLVTYKNAFEYIQTLEYSDKEGILFLEQQLYNLLQKLPEDINILTLLMHEQIMNNRGQRARAIAYKIWESGGVLEPQIERMYIDDLINLGLTDMAGAALAPYISDMENNVQEQSDILLKYAIFIGNMSLLRRILAYLPEEKNYNILRSLLDMNSELQATSHIQPIMAKISENVLESMLGFTYKLFMDREFPEIEFLFYVDDTINNYEEVRKKMHTQISAYCAAHKITDLINMSAVILPIQRRRRQELWLSQQ